MAKWTRARIEVPDKLGGKDRELLGEEIVEFIRKRSSQGLDKDNKKFPKYSKEYINSLDFKNAGKKKTPVNLELSGDMLAAMDVISHKKGSILVGFENGTDENDRAEGNITGSYGRDPNPAKARDFLGVKKGDLKDLVKQEQSLATALAAKKAVSFRRLPLTIIKSIARNLLIGVEVGIIAEKLEKDEQLK